MRNLQSHIQSIPLFLLLVLGTISSSCSSEKPIDSEALLCREWSFESIIDKEGNSIRDISDGDEMLISKNGGSNSFSYTISKENIDATGVWSFTNDTLHYTYFPDDNIYYLDSAILRLKDGKPSISYFRNGKLEASIDDQNLEIPLSSRHYLVSELSEDALVLEENGVTYSFIYTKMAVASGISMTAIFNGFIGILAMILILFLISEKKRKINWRLVISGVLLQVIFALLVLKVPAVRSVFDGISSFFVQILSFTDKGTEFLFGSFVTGKIEVGLINFVVKILPTIIFFAALSSLFYYWGILQKIVFAFAWALKRVMRLSGAESLAAAGNIFLGQTESPLLVKPYIDKMTRSEIMALMSGGMATIAGGVLAAYIGFLGGDDPVQQQMFASHLLSASIMSAPAALVAAKMLVPETEAIDEEMQISRDKIGSNALAAISNGTTDGLRLAVNVGAMLLVFTALMAMLNYICQDWIGDWFGLNEIIVAKTNGAYSGFTMQYILGQLFSPLAWLIGVRGADVSMVGQLLGEKTVLNEFFAYVSLGDMKSSGKLTDSKSIIIATYALCGFANFASIGIQIGGIGAIAPKRRELVSSLGIKALIAGTIACLMTGAIAGMLL